MKLRFDFVGIPTPGLYASFSRGTSDDLHDVLPGRGSGSYYGVRIGNGMTSLQI